MTTGEKLVLINTNDELSGYFFELADGKNKLLKKVSTKFKKEIPAPNTLIPGIPAKFEKQSPNYYIKTNQNLIKVPKNSKELLSHFPENKTDLEKFIKTNKINIKQEIDLIKLVNFLNQ